MGNFVFKTRDERQEEARIKWIKSKCRGTFEFATGFGKTWTAIKCIKCIIDKYPKFKVLIIVPTEPLKNQWLGYLDSNNLNFNCDVQIVNTGIKYNWECNLLVVDEVHRYAADTFQEIFTKAHYKYILGLTATFERLDGKHELIAKHCPVIDKVSTEEALANGWLSEFKEYQVLLDVDDIDTYNSYNREFTEHFEYFDFNWPLAMSMIGKDGFKNRAHLRDLICERESKNTNITDTRRKEVFKEITYHATSFIRAIQNRKSFINNHVKKIEVTRKIIEARPNSKIITFSNNAKMAESIGYGLVYTGKACSSKKKNRITIDEFSACDTGVINSCAKLNEGADIKGLSVAIILGLDSSETKSIQRRGRAIRKEGNKKAEIFNIIINQTVETKWFQKSHENSPYITIDEKGLDDVLQGKEPKPYVRPIKNYTFRF